MSQPARRGAPSRRSGPSGPPQPSTALAKIQEIQALIPAEPLRDVKSWNQTAAALRASGKVTVLSPTVALDHVPPMTQIALSIVQIDPTVDARGTGVDCYFDRRFCDHDRGQPKEVAFGKRALLKIMAEVGLEKLASYRSDDRSDSNYCDWTVVIAGEDLSGKFRQTIRSHEIDLRDGAPETRKPEWKCGAHDRADCKSCNRRDFRKTGKTVQLDDDVLGEKRKNIQALAETKALTAAIREHLQLPHKMKISEISKPILIPKLVPLLDESDPDVKRELVRKRVWGGSALYGQQPVRMAPTRELPKSPPPVPQPLERIETAEGEDVGDQVEAEVVAGADAGGDDPFWPEDETIAASPGDQVDDQGPPPLDDERDPEKACACPCGCPDDLDPVQIRKSKARVKDLRCRGCYPDQNFDFDRHPDDLDLKLPAYPGATAQNVRRWNELRRRGE